MRILVLGSAGGNNLGDVAVLDRNMELIQERIPDAEFVVPTSSTQRTWRLLSRFPVLPVKTGRLRFLSPGVVQAALDCDGAFTCAGIFFDYALFRIRYNFVASLAPLLAPCRRRRIPVVGLNVGVQAPTSSIGARMMRWALNSHDRIFLRDADAVDILRRLGVRAPYELGADPAIACRSHPSGEDRGLTPFPERARLSVYDFGRDRDRDTTPVLARTSHHQTEGTHSLSPGSGLAPVSGEKCRLGFNFTHLLAQSLAGTSPPMSRGGLVRYLADTLRGVYQRTDTRLTLIATERKDHALLREVQEKAALGDICDLAPWSDFTETRGRIAGCDVFVGTRLHSLIFACGVGVPFVAIPYQPKVAAFVRDVGLPPGFLLDGWWQGAEHLAERIAGACSHPEETRAPMAAYVRDASCLSQRAVDCFADLVRARARR